MNIALIRMPSYEVSCPPINLAYLSAYLQAQRHRVTAFDFNIEAYNNSSPQIKRSCWKVDTAADQRMSSAILPQQYDAWARRVISTKPRVVGFSLYNTNLLPSLQLAERIKAKNSRIKIVFGGPYCRREEGIVHQLALHPCSDAVVVGDGEETLAALVSRFAKKGRGSVRGALVKENKGIIDGGTAALIADLDLLPFPDYTDFPLDRYKARTMPLLGSRGCVNNCAFCNTKNCWNTYYHRSADNILREIDSLHKQFGVTFFSFFDLSINSNPAELKKLCSLLVMHQLKEQYTISWGAQACLDRMDDDLIAWMKFAGCVFLLFGLENGSPRNLALVNKRIDLARAEATIKKCFHNGIRMALSWIIGFPGETPQDFEQNIALAKRLGPYAVFIATPLRVLLNSDLRKNPGKYGIRRLHSTDSLLWEDDVHSPQERLRMVDRFNRAARLHSTERAVNVARWKK